MFRRIAPGVFALALMLLSCEKTPEPVISIVQKEYSVGSQGGDISVNVNANVVVSAVPSEGWITQSSSAESGGVWRFAVARNDSYDQRSARITFSCSGVSETVTVTQAQQDAIIPGGLEYKIFYEEQTFTLPVSSNVDFSVSVSGGDWIKSVGTKGLNSKELRFSVAENSGKTTREATIAITSGNLNQSIKIEQLPTTHRPVTKEDWRKSIDNTQKIAEKSKIIIDNNPKDLVTGWDTDKIAKELSALDEIIQAFPDKSDNKVYVIQRDSSLIPVILEFEELDDDEESQPDSYSLKESRPLTRSQTADNGRKSIAPNGPKKKALLLAPFLSDGIKVDSKHIKGELKPLGYNDDDVTYLHDDEVKLDHVSGDSLATYDLIIINTHGGMWNYEFLRDSVTNELILDSKGHAIGTDEPHTVLCLGPMKQSEIDLFLNSFDEDKKEVIRPYIQKGKTSWGLGKKWFEETTSSNTKFPNSLIFAFACHSFEKEDLFDYFTHNLAAEYCGFIDNVYSRETSRIINSLISSLSKGMSFQDASSYTFSQHSFNARSIYRAKPREGFTSSDVFLVDPKAFDLKQKQNGNQLTLIWNNNYTSGEYRYDVYLDGGLVKNNSQTNRAITIPSPSPGPHKWFVISNLIEEGKDIASYRSDEISFQIEDFPESRSIFSVSSTSMDFGEVAVGTQSEGQSLTFTNEGNADLNVSIVSRPEGFNLPRIESFTVRAGQSRGNFIFYFAPTEVKKYRSELVLSTNDPDHPTVRIVLTGSGKDAGNPRIRSSVSDLDFGSLTNLEQLRKTAQIKNIGSGPLVIKLKSLTSNHEGLIWQSSLSDVAVTVAPGEIYDLNIYFQPKDPYRDFTGSLVIETNDPDSPTVSISLKGTGVYDDYQDSKVRILEMDSSRYLLMGRTTAGKTSSISYQIENTLDFPVTIRELSVEGPFKTTANGMTVPAKSTQSIRIQFAPTEISSYLGVLNYIIESDQYNQQLFFYIDAIGTRESKYVGTLQDMGLSVKWATCNLGADRPYYFGDYFAWGETRLMQPYNLYQWWTGGDHPIIKKYGLVDNRVELLPEDDAASVLLGSGYRIPTASEFQELIDQCNWTWTQRGGVNGYLVTSKKNGKSIFLPAAMQWSDPETESVNGHYWTSSLVSPDPGTSARNLSFSASRSPVLSGGQRDFGYSIRPVYGAPASPAITVSHSSFNFGTVDRVNDKAKDQNFTITNSGTGTLTVTSVSLETGGLIFRLSGKWKGGDLGPGESATIGVRFSPSSAGTFRDKVIISSNAGTKTITLRGTGK